jgi:hypothetical protein
MTVVPLSRAQTMAPRGEWFADARSSQGQPGDRALRVTWHLDIGCVVLSSWRDGGCVSTTRLSPDDAARLISVLAEGLAAAAEGGMIESATTG